MYPDLYEKILRAGHRVGNHTYSHQKGWGMSVERYVEDIDFASDLVHTNLFRPPYARITPSQINVVCARYKIVLWSLLTMDYRRNLHRNVCANRVVNNFRAGDIILFHDSEKAFKNMSYALPKLLKRIKERGLQCKAIEL
jgi:peptidoglycan/xylan/chitin deacetylase (PgdA/CDA1 family)